MEFTNSIQKKFSDAGCFTGRNVIHKYGDKATYNAMPEFLKSFLKEYGDSKISYMPYQNSGLAVEEIFFDPGDLDFENTQDFDDLKEIYGFEMYPFAYSTEGTGYRIACDAQGNVYMLGGSGDFLRGSSLPEGLENIITRDYSQSKDFDEPTKTWI